MIKFDQLGFGVSIPEIFFPPSPIRGGVGGEVENNECDIINLISTPSEVA